MNKYYLKDIVDLQTGLVLARASAKQADSKKSGIANGTIVEIKNQYKYVTLKSINNYGELEESKCEIFESKEPISNRYLTKKDDILFGLFEPIKSCYILESKSIYVVPSQFVTIKIKSQFQESILPEYIYTVFQQKEFKNQVLQKKEGFLLKTIKISDIGNVIISIPNLEQQRKIVEIHKLIVEKEKLYSELLEQQKKYDQILFEKLIKGSSK